MTIPLTGTQYDIEAGDYRATVTELGAGLRELKFTGTPLVTSYDADQLPPHGAGQLLTPWPNRVDGGRYSFGGTEYQLALSEPASGNAIHGLTRWIPWTRVTHDRSEVTLRSVPHGQQGYPFAVQVHLTYRLNAWWGSAAASSPPATACCAVCCSRCACSAARFPAAPGPYGWPIG